MIGSVGTARFAWAVYTLVFAFAVLPVLLTGFPPLADLPNHLARAYIIDQLPSDADLQKYYAIHWRILSFQATDLVLPPLVAWVGVSVAAKLYIAVTFALLLAGTASLHRVLFGRVGLWPAASAAFLFNFLLAWGFVAFLSAVGLVLLLFAGWMATQERCGVLRTLIFAVFALLLLFFHLFAFASYAVLIAAYECGRTRLREATLRRHALRLAEAAASLIPAAVLVVASLDLSVPTVYQQGNLADVARGFISPTVMYMDWADFAVTYIIVAAFWVFIRRRMLGFDRRMTAPLLVLLVLALIMPVSLSSVWGANLRLPCLLSFLLVAATELRVSERAQRLIGAAIVVLVAFRAIALAVSWQSYDKDIAEFRGAAERIDRGKRVLTTMFPAGYQRRREPAIFPLVHLAAFSVIDRDVFLPTLFTFATPLRFTADTRDLTANVFGPREKITWQPQDPAFASADAATRRGVEALAQTNFLHDSYLSAVDWSHWPEQYDYLIDFHFGAAGNPVPALLTSVAQGRFFTIYRIHPPE